MEDNTKSAGPNSKTGTTQHTPLPPFNGTTTHKTGMPATLPPFPHHATHHHNDAPPSTMAPPTTTVRGEWTEDTPPHERRRHALTTRTPQHLAENSARHDSSTSRHCNGMSRARITPLHRAGQQQHTPPPFHTPRRMDTIHSSTHPLSLIHVHTTDDQR